MGILGLVLVFGLTVVGCDNGSTDNKSKNFTVTFDANGGLFNTESVNNTSTGIIVKSGETVPSEFFELNIPQKTNNNFVGWNTEANGSGTVFDESTSVTASIIVYAQWEWIQPIASTLSANTWTEGSLAIETEEWFMFTATTTKQYIHLNYTGLGYARAQVYTEFGFEIGSNQWLSSGYGSARPDEAGSFYRELEIGQNYYIRVQQAGSGTYYKGAYRIAITETGESPQLETLPTEGVVSLTANTWADGEQGNSWFSFTASASTQYVHILPGTRTAFWVKVYGSNGGTIGDFIYSSGNSAAGPWELETGKTYFIGFTDEYWGTFQVAFNDSTTPPPVALPTEDAISLTANIWADGTTSGGEWYKFTANATTQYIHFDFTTATGASVKIYNNTGNLEGTQKSPFITTPSFSVELSNGSIYYLYVNKGLYDGAFRITFNTSETAPTITLPVENIIELTANTWSTASTAYDGKQWFRFTANASMQYIHINGVSIEISLRLYNANGNAVGTPIRCGPQGGNNYFSQMVTSGQLYYVKAEGVGYPSDYKISFNTSETPPEL